MLSLRSLLKLAKELDADAFVARVQDPVLLLEEQHGQSSTDRFQTITGRSGESGRQAATTGEDASPSDIISIRKKARGKFSNMISVGRTTSNDVVIDLASVSKFHAYFFSKKPSQQWYLQDADSANGTFVDDRPLSKASPALLKDGCSVEFSRDTRFRFYTPEAFYRFLRPSP
jgi:pSer/pThr/pTyr-binding forkhead associated (FHA) protein